jgi:hypothetical protein
MLAFVIVQMKRLKKYARENICVIHKAEGGEIRKYFEKSKSNSSNQLQ